MHCAKLKANKEWDTVPIAIGENAPRDFSLISFETLDDYSLVSFYFIYDLTLPKIVFEYHLQFK